MCDEPTDLPNSSDCHRVDLDRLIGEFYPVQSGVTSLGKFDPCTIVPGKFDALLRHEHHMTVTVESHYGRPVDVVVHRYHTTDHWYVREITLVLSGTNEVVQYGIVRFDTTAVAPEVWRRIESRTVPLGRVLIEHDVLRQVHLCGLWEIQVGRPMARLLGCNVGKRTFGRTALIDCNGRPAIELLEVVV